MANLLAAVSIIASGIAFLYQTLWQDNKVELKAVVAGSNQHVLSILATNSGGKDLVITSAAITSKALPDGEPKFLKIPAAGELIKKGTSLLLTPRPSDLSPVVKMKDADASNPIISKTECIAHIEYVDPDGDTHKIDTPFKCYAGCVVDTLQDD